MHTAPAPHLLPRALSYSQAENLLGIILLVLALLGFSGLVAALESIAVILLIVAVIVIAWRIITGRKPV